MIIWIDSFPRSGNTLYRMLLYHYCGVRTYSVHNDPMFSKAGFGEQVGHERLPVSHRLIFQHREKAVPRVRRLIESPLLYMTKTHAFVEGVPFPAPTVYIVRDGRDAEVSFTHYQMWRDEKPNFPARLRDRIRNKSRWSEHVLGWLAETKAVVKYEDMVRAPQRAIHQSLKALGLPFRINPNKRVPSFEEMHQICPGFFRRGQIGSYKSEMPKGLQQLFWRKHHEALEALGYGRE